MLTVKEKPPESSIIHDTGWTNVIGNGTIWEKERFTFEVDTRVHIYVRYWKGPSGSASIFSDITFGAFFDDNPTIITKIGSYWRCLENPGITTIADSGSPLTGQVYYHTFNTGTMTIEFQDGKRGFELPANILFTVTPQAALASNDGYCYRIIAIKSTGESLMER